MKAFFKAVVDRVWKSYKSTLAGLGIGVVILILDQVVVAAESTESAVLKVAASLAVVIGAALKSKALPPA